VHSEIEVSMVQVVDGQTWSEKHLVKDYKLNVPFKGGK
jgi:hypothetical protein